MFSLLYAWRYFNNMHRINNFLISLTIVRQSEKISGQDNAVNNKYKSLRKKWNFLNELLKGFMRNHYLLFC